MGFQWFGVIKMHVKGGDDDMKGVFGDRAAERMFHMVDNYGHRGTADRTDLI